MLGHQFYPTPKTVIRKMIDYSGVNLKERTILDPSAGKGDLLNYIKGKSPRYDDNDYYAIEIDNNLQSILRDNKYPVIDTDFLTYEPDMFFDLIIMNPPFDRGVDHLMKAIDISHNTEIICLLNAETLLNPYTDKRKILLDLINQFGKFEIIGNVFSEAERKTDVNIALVYLKIENQNQNFDFSFMEENIQAVEFDESCIKNEIARDDKIGNMMIHFDQARKAYKKYIETQKECEYRIKNIVGDDPYFKFDDFDVKNGSSITRFNNFSSKIKLKMWKEVIKKLELERYMTNSVRKNFQQYIQQQANSAFTKQNVTAFINHLLMNGSNILNNAIIEVFEMLTANYYSENRMYVEGWKTNDRYKVNRKVIAPDYVRYGEYKSSYDLKKYGDTFSLDYRGKEQYTDIDKVMSFISGRSFEHIVTITEALESKFKELGKVYSGTFDNKCESTFFEIKFYKKGTVHLKFKDTWLWEEFNMRACSGKNWLPDNERAKWEAKKSKTKKSKSSTNQPQLLLS